MDYYCSYSCIANCFDRCIFSIKNQFSPEKQASNIAQAIKKDDEKALAKEVTTQNDQKLSKQEARAYLNYIKTEDDLNNVGSNVEQSAKEIKDNRYNNLSVDANGNNVLNISKDGKKFLFFDNYSFNVPQKSVSIYPSSSGDITYEYNGKSVRQRLRKMTKNVRYVPNR